MGPVNSVSIGKDIQQSPTFPLKIFLQRKRPLMKHEKFVADTARPFSYGILYLEYNLQLTELPPTSYVELQNLRARN